MTTAAFVWGALLAGYLLGVVTTSLCAAARGATELGRASRAAAYEERLEFRAAESGRLTRPSMNGHLPAVDWAFERAPGVSWEEEA